MKLNDMQMNRVRLMMLALASATGALYASLPTAAVGQAPGATVRLADVMMRDAAVLPDSATGTYYIVASARVPGGGVRAYASKDLVNWEGPHIIYQAPPEMWGSDVSIRSVWAPEMHEYEGRYYLFLTFDSNWELPEQWDQWFTWPARVRRASQVLVSESPLGPFLPFSNEPTLPADMMTLDATLWVEDGVPFMVFCHEWVQIVDGAVSMVQLQPDLSAIVGEPEVLFRGSAGPWAHNAPPHRSWVTDGPWLHRSHSGKLFMLWSGFGPGGYTVGIAVSESGRLAGPWVQQAEPIYADDGGHPMLFRTFDGKLMMTLHSPNSGADQRIHFFEMEDTGETLRIVRRFTPGE